MFIWVTQGLVEPYIPKVKPDFIKRINPLHPSVADKSIEVGLKKAKRLKYEFILTFDADDQHPHRKIPFFLNLRFIVLKFQK